MEGMNRITCTALLVFCMVSSVYVYGIGQRLLIQPADIKSSVSDPSKNYKNYNASVPRWDWLPDAGPFSNGDQGQWLNLSSGVELWWTRFGKKSEKTPVLFCHGGTGNSNQMYHQANHLAKTREVILHE
jgi:hypothetical protein